MWTCSIHFHTPWNWLSPVSLHWFLIVTDKISIIVYFVCGTQLYLWWWGKKRHLIATTRNNSVELKTWLCSQNTNQLILHCIYWWRRIEAQLVHRDDVKLQCLTRIKCFTLSLCEPVNVRPTQKEYCHLLVHLLMSHWKPPAWFSCQ